MSSVWGWVAAGAAAGLTCTAITYGSAPAGPGELHQQWPAAAGLVDAMPLWLGAVGLIAGRLREADRGRRRDPIADEDVARIALDPIVVVDERGIVLSANRACALVFGADLVGAPIHDLVVDLGRRDPPRTERRGANGALVGVEWHLTARRWDGTFLPVRVTAGPVGHDRLVYLLSPQPVSPTLSPEVGSSPTTAL